MKAVLNCGRCLTLATVSFSANVGHANESIPSGSPSKANVAIQSYDSDSHRLDVTPPLKANESSLNVFSTATLPKTPSRILEMPVIALANASRNQEEESRAVDDAAKSHQVDTKSEGSNTAREEVPEKEATSKPVINWTITIFIIAQFAIHTFRDVFAALGRRLFLAKRYGNPAKFTETDASKSLEKAGLNKNSLNKSEKLDNLTELSHIKMLVDLADEGLRMVNQNTGGSSRLQNCRDLLSGISSWMKSCNIKPTPSSTYQEHVATERLKRIESSIKALEPTSKDYQKAFDSAVEAEVALRLHNLDTTNRETTRELSLKIAELKEEQNQLNRLKVESQEIHRTNQELRRQASMDKRAAEATLEETKLAILQNRKEIERLQVVTEQMIFHEDKLERLRVETEEYLELGLEEYLNTIKKGDSALSLVAFEYLLKLHDVEKIMLNGQGHQESQS